MPSWSMPMTTPLDQRYVRARDALRDSHGFSVGIDHIREAEKLGRVARESIDRQSFSDDEVIAVYRLAGFGNYRGSGT